MTKKCLKHHTYLFYGLLIYLIDSSLLCMFTGFIHSGMPIIRFILSQAVDRGQRKYFDINNSILESNKIPVNLSVNPKCVKSKSSKLGD